MGWSWLTLSGHKKAPFLISFVSTLTKEARNKLLCTQESISSTTMATKGAWLVSMRKLISSYRGGSSFFFIKKKWLFFRCSFPFRNSPFPLPLQIFLKIRFYPVLYRSHWEGFSFFFYHYKHIIQIHKMYISNKQRAGQQLLWRCQVSTKTFI